MFYDTHAHLDFPEFASELDQIIERAQAAGIDRIVSIGTDLKSSARVIKLAERYPCVYAAVGWHPSYVMEAPDDIRSELRKLANHPKVAAIGEIGLDYYRLPSQQPGKTVDDDVRYKQKQSAIFAQQLEVAADLGLNCVIHQRASLEDTIKMMEPYVGKLRGVFHCFVDNAEAMRRVLALGSLVSFTGIITFKNAQEIRDTAAATPLDQLMLETDCPFLAPVPYRCKRCEPAYVKEIAEMVATVKGCSLEQLGNTTSATARSFFRMVD